LPLGLKDTVEPLRAREELYEKYDAVQSDRLLGETSSMRNPPTPFRSMGMFGEVKAPALPNGPATVKVPVPSANRMFRGMIPIETAEDRDIAFVGLILTITSSISMQV
jgi:hypothetical protein